jgi:hypothetical protein
MTGATPRGPISRARKRRIWEAADGRCACGAEVPIEGSGVTYDHDVQLWMGGPEADENVRPLCDRCAALKTAVDSRARAKVRRLWLKALGAPSPDGRWPTRPFAQYSRPMGKRPQKVPSAPMKPKPLFRPPAEPAPTAKGGGIVSRIKGIQQGYSPPPPPGSMLIAKKYKPR